MGATIATAGPVFDKVDEPAPEGARRSPRESIWNPTAGRKMHGFPFGLSCEVRRFRREAALREGRAPVLPVQRSCLPDNRTPGRTDARSRPWIFRRPAESSAGWARECIGNWNWRLATFAHWQQSAVGECCQYPMLPIASVANGLAEKGGAKRRAGAGGGESDEDAVQGFGSQANRTPVPSGDEE